MLNREQIEKIIPHRAPMLLIDEITELQEDGAVGLTHIKGDELFLQGHFPGNPVVPGVFLLEMLAQTGAVALMSRPPYEGKTGYYAGIDKAKFRRKVVPGDTVRLEVKMVKARGMLVVAEGVAYVDDQKAAEAVMTFAVGD